MPIFSQLTVQLEKEKIDEESTGKKQTKPVVDNEVHDLDDVSDCSGSKFNYWVAL